jgi:hypothetical protein
VMKMAVRAGFWRKRLKSVTATMNESRWLKKERGKQRALSRSCYLSFQSLRMVLTTHYRRCEYIHTMMKVAGVAEGKATNLKGH